MIHWTSLVNCSMEHPYNLSTYLERNNPSPNPTMFSHEIEDHSHHDGKYDGGGHNQVLN